MATLSKTYAYIHEARSAVAHYFQVKWDEAFENARFMRQLQFTDDQLRKISKTDRVPYVLDYISIPINTHIGDQRDNRTDIMYLPVEAGDDVRAEVLNVVKDSMLRQNHWIYTASDIFQDGIIEKCGAVGYEWTTEKNPKGELRVFRIPPRQLTWDLNRRDYELAKSLWVSRTRLYGRREMMNKFAEHKSEIEKLSSTLDELDDLNLDESYRKQISDLELDALALIEFYEKDYKSRFFVEMDGRKILDGFYLTRKEAEDGIEGLKARQEQFANQFTELNIIPPPPPSYDIIQHDVPVVLRSEICQNIVFTDRKETNLSDYPYDAYYPYWHDGEWWSMVDMYKDPQRFINKMFMMVDHQIGVNSKGILLIDENVPDTQAKQIIDGWSGTGFAGRIKDPKNNIEYIPPQGFDPRLLAAMEIAINNLEKKSGGGNYFGQKETAGEAAAAIRQRIERGGVSSFPVFDNFDRFLLSAGEKIAWYLTSYMTAEQKMRIEGEELTALARQEFPDWYKDSVMPNLGFLTINTSPQNTIKDLTVDIIVDKSRHSVTKNQQILAQLAVMMQSSPLLAESVPPELLLELFDLPATVKRKMQQSMQQLLQVRMQKDMASVTKPPSLSASFADIKMLPPEAQVQFAKLFGIELPEPVNGEDVGMKDVLKLQADTIRQDKDLALKREKHQDQSLLKTMALWLQSQKSNREKVQ